MEAKGIRLRKRPNGSFYVVWTGNSNGVPTGTRERRAAEAFLAAFITSGGPEAVKDAPDALAQPAGLTVMAAFDNYMREHIIAKNLPSRGICELTQGYVAAHFGPNRLVTDLVTADFDDIDGDDGYIQRRRASRLVIRKLNPRPASDTTIHGELCRLQTALLHNATFTPRGMPKPRINKGEIIEIPKPTPAGPRDYWLRDHEEDHVLAHAYAPKSDGKRLHKLYRFVVIAMDQAARKRAIEELTWPQIDFDRGLIDFNPPGRAQTSKHRPHIPMTSRVRAMLLQAYAERVSDYVLDNDGCMRELMDGLRHRANMPKLTAHVFRHTWCSRAAMAGESMQSIADFIGDNLQTVIDNYYHFSPDYLRSVANFREREAANRRSRAA